MARIITEYLKAVEKAQYDKREAISKGGETAHYLYQAEKTCQEAISKAGWEAIEKAKKLFGLKYNKEEKEARSLAR